MSYESAELHQVGPNEYTMTLPVDAGLAWIAEELREEFPDATVTLRKPAQR